MEQRRLIDMLHSGRAPHAILISGPAGSGRRTLARTAAAVWCLEREEPALLSGCPNYMELEGGSAGVEDVRALIARMAVQPWNGGRQAFALLDAHLFNPQSQNALLKTLEEPPDGSLLLLSGAEAGLLPTVRSRCAIFRLGAQPPETVAAELTKAGADPSAAHNAAGLAEGVPGAARLYMRERYVRFCADAQAVLADALFGPTPFADAAKLLATPFDPPGQEEGKTALAAENAETVLRVWQAALRDALIEKTGGPAPRTDGALAARIAARFTIGAIQGMIKATLEAERLLRFRASPAQLIDTALVRLLEERGASI